MGGMGSGERWSKKRVVEGRHAIDTADLKRWKLLSPGVTNRSGTLTWHRGGAGAPVSSVVYRSTVGATDGTLRLLYSTTAPKIDLDYTVRLVTTRCHLGGVRWWFVCPLVHDGVACGRRVRKLYLGGRYFGCRHCHNLTYRSTQESDGRVYAALRAGMHLGGFTDTVGLSVTQLGFALKVLTAGQKRLERIGQRMDKIGRGKRGKLPEKA